MDENYLDSLLGEVSEDKNKQNNLDFSIDEDAGIDIDMSDLDSIPLDEMDDIGSLNLDDLDLDDIDFDDVDVTNLEKKLDLDSREEDFDMESLMTEEAASEDTASEDTAAEEADLGMDLAADLDMNLDEEHIGDELDEVFAAADLKLEQDTNSPEVYEENFGGDSGISMDVDPSNMNLDDIFSALGIDDSDNSAENSYTSSESELDDLLQNATMDFSLDDIEFDDIKDISEEKTTGNKKDKKQKKSVEKKKKTFSEVLFGEPDEDDAEEERYLAEKKAEKQAKKEQKKIANEEKKAAKAEALELKKQGDEKKRKEKEDRKKAKDEELRVELEAEKSQKKVPTFVVIIVFAAFALLAAGVIYGTKLFSYNQVIRRASDYFDRDRYRLAYDEVSGVEVKKKDEDLRDRIYTVMYVERLYESYSNNMQLGRYDKALDALIRGIQKYDEHYEEAVELEIVDDINLCRTRIVDALITQFNMTEEDAYRIMELEGADYNRALVKYTENITYNEE